MCQINHINKASLPPNLCWLQDIFKSDGSRHTDSPYWYAIRFLLNFAVFRVFLWISQLCSCSKYQKPCTYELRHFHFTNWRLNICIWRLYFSGWSPQGDLKIFLISSPEMVVPLHSTPQSLTLLASFLALVPLFTFLASLRALSKSLNWLDWSFSNWKSSFILNFWLKSTD